MSARARVFFLLLFYFSPQTQNIKIQMFGVHVNPENKYITERAAQKSMQANKHSIKSPKYA